MNTLCWLGRILRASVRVACRVVQLLGSARRALAGGDGRRGGAPLSSSPVSQVAASSTPSATDPYAPWASPVEPFTLDAGVLALDFDRSLVWSGVYTSWETLVRLDAWWCSVAYLYAPAAERG